MQPFTWVFTLPLLLSAFYLLMTQVAQPPVGLRPKIFVIGTSKTGTTSIGNALYMIGYRRLGWREVRSRHLVHSYIHSDFDALEQITRFYDAFEDLPWPGMYRQMADLYPDAKFILSLRRDDYKWLSSLRTHLSRGSWSPADFWYGAIQVDGREEVVLQKYRNHTASVRQFFLDKPERYVELVVDGKEGDERSGWDALCRVAQCPGGRIPDVPFPRSNTIAHWRDDSFRGTLKRSRGRFLSKLEVHLTKAYYSGAYPLMNRSLESIWHVINVIEMGLTNLFYQCTSRKPLPLK